MSLLGNHISLMHGWLPIAVQIGSGVTLGLAAGWRSRRWRLSWLPAAAAVGGAFQAIVTHSYLADHATDTAPDALFVWIALLGMATAVLILGWRGARSREHARRYPGPGRAAVSALLTAGARRWGRASFQPCKAR